MPALIVRLFGNLAVHRGDELLPVRVGKMQELFCYMLLKRHRTHSRESLAALLWGDFTIGQSKKYLRQTLWQLQTILSSDCDQQRVLQVGHDSAGMAPDSGLWLDVDVFERMCSTAPALGGEDLTEDCANTLRHAAELYSGDLLEGWYQDWCLGERERLQNLFLGTLDKLIRHCEDRGLYQEGLEYGERILRVDRTRERTHQQMIKLYYLAGDRAGALRQFGRCESALAEDLQVKPSRKTTELCDLIRAEKMEGHYPAPVIEIRPNLSNPTEPPRLAGLLNRLRELQGSLNAVQEQVAAEIYAVEQQLSRSESFPPKRRAAPVRRP